VHGAHRTAEKNRPGLKTPETYALIGCPRSFWSRGYCVSTVGLDEQKIRRYIREQERHEKEEMVNSICGGGLLDFSLRWG